MSSFEEKLQVLVTNKAISKNQMRKDTANLKMHTSCYAVKTTKSQSDIALNTQLSNNFQCTIQNRNGVDYRVYKIAFLWY